MITKIRRVYKNRKRIKKVKRMNNLGLIVAVQIKVMEFKIEIGGK